MKREEMEEEERSDQSEEILGRDKNTDAEGDVEEIQGNPLSAVSGLITFFSPLFPLPISIHVNA